MGLIRKALQAGPPQLGYSIGSKASAMTHETPSPPVHDIRLLHDRGVPMRDGVRLSADVYLPRSAGSFPTILTRTPYESGRDAFITLAVWFARRGYAFVIQDCRGRYESEGVFHAYAHDAEDGYDTVDWLAGQPWCDGKIGTWGRSYGGLTQWLPAPLANPHLSCMAPHVICDDFFSDCHYLGGAFQLMLSLGAAVIWETNMVTVAGAHTAAIFQNRRFWQHLPLVDLDERAIGRKIPYWREWLEHANLPAMRLVRSLHRCRVSELQQHDSRRRNPRGESEPEGARRPVDARSTHRQQPWRSRLWPRLAADYA